MAAIENKLNEDDEKPLTAAEKAIAAKKAEEERIQNLLNQGGVSYSHTNTGE